MNMKKRYLLCAFMACLLTFTFVGCQSGEDEVVLKKQCVIGNYSLRTELEEMKLEDTDRLFVRIKSVDGQEVTFDPFPKVERYTRGRWKALYFSEDSSVMTSGIPTVLENEEGGMHIPMRDLIGGFKKGIYRITMKLEDTDCAIIVKFV